MNNNKIMITAVVALLTTATIFTGCKKDDDEASPANTQQKLTMHIHTNVGSSTAVYGTQYQDATGRKFKISDLRYYLSNIILIKSDGSEYPLTNKVLLVNPATEDYELANVPIGSYKGFKFIIGLDSATNHSDPTTYAATSPLAIQTPAIHWSWNSGYIFMKIEGQVDTTLANTGTPNYDMFYHIGLDSYKRTIDFSNEAFTVTSGSDQEIAVKFDLLSALNNVDMRTENATHTMDNMMLATKVANNWVSAFVIL